MRLGGNDTGLTLLELVVAILILSLGSLAAIRATDQSRIVIGQDRARILAQEVALNRIEALKLTLGSLPGQVTMGGIPFTVATTEKTTAAGLREVTVQVQSATGPGAVFVAYLPERSF